MDHAVEDKVRELVELQVKAKDQARIINKRKKVLWNEIHELLRPDLSTKAQLALFPAPEEKP